MQKLILNLPNSNSRGHDEVTNTVLKLLYIEISPVLCHLFNTIIRTATFPEIFKLARILPLSKPDKNPLEISSYRPLNNLPSVEKLFEAYWLVHF